MRSAASWVQGKERMATRITITKPLEERLRRMAAEEPEALGTYSATTARQLLAKVEDGQRSKEMAKKFSSHSAVALAKRVLGLSAVSPMTFTPAFYSLVKRKIELLGLTEDDVERAAARAKQTLRQPFSLLYFFQCIDRLLVPNQPPEVGVLGEVSEPTEQKVTTGRGDDE